MASKFDLSRRFILSKKFNQIFIVTKQITYKRPFENVIIFVLINIYI